MNSLKTACLYSYGCRMAKEKEVGHILLSCIKKESKFSKEETWQALQKLQSYQVYRLIAMLESQSDIFDEAVVRSYWLGNVNPKSNDLRKLNHNFATLDKIRIFGKISTDKVKALINCSISCGEVIKINSDKIELSEVGLMLIEKRIIFGRRKRKVGFGFLDRKKLRKGDILSIHISMARELINQSQELVLSERTSEALKALAL